MTLLPLLVFLILIYLPGRACLVVLRALDAEASPLACWSAFEVQLLALGVGIAFWPLLFALQAAIPLSPDLGRASVALLLLAAFVLVAAEFWLRGRARWTGLEWLAFGVFGMILATRIAVVLEYPYPAWSDSLHHVLLTQGTAALGRLPETLAPWFPEIPVVRYHRGLYALAAPLQWLAGVPAHTALLWTGQALNGLVGIGVYLALARRVTPAAGIVGAVTVGLLARHPALWVNWGRFTQLAGQILLPFAWLVTWDALRVLREHSLFARGARGICLLAALLSGGVVLLHFRVALFYALLVLVTLLFEALAARRSGQGRRLAAGTAGLGLAAAVAVGPAFWHAVWVHFVGHWMAASQRGSLFLVPGARTYGAEAEFFGFPWSSITEIVARVPLLVAASLGACVGLWRRQAFAGIVVVWALLLLGLGSLHHLGIPALNLTNEGAVLIGLYLPLGLLVGAGFGAWSTARGKTAQAATADPPPLRALGAFGLAGVVLLGTALAPERVRHIDPGRFLVTPADLAAYEWIRQNTPADARFAVEPYFWMKNFPHPADGGLWISYFTGRSTLPGPMISPLAPAWHRRSAAMSRRIERLGESRLVAHELARRGIRWVYLDARRPPDGLDAAAIVAAGNAQIRYERNGIIVLELDDELSDEFRAAAESVVDEVLQRGGFPAADWPEHPPSAPEGTPTASVD
ncbi:MAG: hypothetical protein ABGY42_08215 [bacterium]